MTTSGPTKPEPRREADTVVGMFPGNLTPTGRLVVTKKRGFSPDALAILWDVPTTVRAALLTAPTKRPEPKKD